MSDLICELVKETDPFLREKPEVFDFESPQVDPEKLSTQLNKLTTTQIVTPIGAKTTTP